MRLRLILPLLLTPVLSVPLGISSAADRNTCILEHIRAITQPTESGLATSQALEDIRKTFYDPSLSPKQAALLAFDHVLSERLKLLSPEVISGVKTVLESRTQIKTGEFEGHYVPLLNRTQISLPEKLRETFIEYMLLIHETEHAIQSHTIRFETGAAKNFGKNAKIGFESERGAMIAEWNYLRTIPIDVKERMIQELFKMDTLFPANRDFLIRALGNSNKSSPEYLSNEWQAGRYPTQFFEKEENSSDLMIKLIIATGIGAELYVIADQCQHPNKASPSFPTFTYQHLCVPMGF